MIWPNTSGDIALMANVHSGWDFSEMKNPGISVCAYPLSIAGSHGAISGPFDTSDPQPTECGLIHSAPKSLFHGGQLPHGGR